MGDQPRTPAGQPAGGEFTTRGRSEAETSLSPISGRRPAADLRHLADVAASSGAPGTSEHYHQLATAAEDGLGISTTLFAEIEEFRSFAGDERIELDAHTRRALDRLQVEATDWDDLRAGAVFIHPHSQSVYWKPGPGEKYADTPQARCIVTSRRGDLIYYRYAESETTAPGWKVQVGELASLAQMHLI